MHEDLAGACDPSSPAQADPQGHGTTVAGIIAARTNNGLGIAGLSQSTILSYPVALGAVPEVHASLAAFGIVRSVLSGASIVSMSWGYKPDTCDNPVHNEMACEPLARAVQFAHAQGALLVAAAGNEGALCAHPVRIPAAFPEVVAVGHVDSNMFPRSTCGPEMDLVAPGWQILSTAGSPHQDGCIALTVGSMYCSTGGSSHATPHVSGTAALIWSACPGLTRDEVREHIEGNLETLDPIYPPNQVGGGFLRADWAFSAAIADPDCI